MIFAGLLFALAVSFAWLISFIGIFPPTLRTVAEADALWWHKITFFSPEAWNQTLYTVIFPVLAVMLFIYCVSLVRDLSYEFNLKNLRTLRGAFLWLLAVCGVFVSIIFALLENLLTKDYVLIRLLDFSPKLYQFAYYIPFTFVPVAGLAVAWLAAGTASTRKAGWKRHMTTAITGTAVGFGIIVVSYIEGLREKIINGASLVYHGEPFEFNPYYIKFMFFIVFLYVLLITGWVAGMVKFFSFREFSLKARMRWAGIPLAICMVIFIFHGIIYLDNRDELNELKRPFDELTGISLEEQPPHEMVLLRNSSAETVQWPSELEFRNTFEPVYNEKWKTYSKRSELYPATYENLKKLSEYIERSKGGEVRSDYVYALSGGYITLWDKKAITETVVRYSKDFHFFRLFSWTMFSSMPTTDENKALFLKLAKGSRWNEDTITAHRLCIMYKDMDMADEGEKWCVIVRKDWEEEPEARHIPVNGTIRGNITRNGETLSKGKIVLLRAYNDIASTIDSEYWRGSMFSMLIATAEPGPQGEFEFTELKDIGRQGYELTVVFDSPLADEVKGIDNPPGFINVTSEENFFDLGTINIRTTGKY